MLERLKDLPQGIDGLKAVGKVTREDYNNVLEPILDDARREGRRVRFLYQLGAEFDGFTPGAAWEDVKIGFRSLRLFDGCAVVSDASWLRESARLIGFMMPCPVRVFENQAREQAVEWLRTLPENPSLVPRLLPELGVMVVEVRRALRAQDFDSLAVTADTWIEAHGELSGIVIHAREFPGWENLGSLIRHIRFIHDHHLKIERIALAADSKLASIAPSIAQHFVKGEVKAFGYNALESAIAWARGPAERGTGESGR